MKESDNIPFDPGYSAISFSFINESNALTETFCKLKTPHQKKFELSKIEPKVISLINSATAFYLGCILWGGYIHFRYKNQPKNIDGNHTLKLSEEEKEELDCAIEVRNMFEFIRLFDRDCKYYLNHPAKISENIFEILNNYIDFAEINNNFVEVTKTSDVKIPKCIEHFSTHSEEKLDELKDKILEIIESKKIESLYEIGYFQ